MVVQNQTSESQPELKNAARTKYGYRLGLVVAVASVLVSIALLPFALSSLFGAFHYSPSQPGFELSANTTLRGEWTKLNIAAISMNEASQSITLRVTGFHNCPSICKSVERLQLFSVHTEPSGALGSPPSAYVDLPTDSSDIDQQITLPMEGKLIDYPFDHYRLLLGITFSNISASGNIVPIDRAQNHAGLEYTVDNNIARVSMSTPRPLMTSTYDTKGVHYDTLTSLSFFRPSYLRILTALLTLLIILAAAYGVLFRPFTQIIPTVGGLVLGVWGVRSLLVGSYPPDSTGVDLVLETAILLLLVVVALRAALFMWPRASIRYRGDPATEDSDVDQVFESSDFEPITE